MLLTPKFDEEAHAYTTPDGIPLVSVTQALVSASIIDTRWFDEQSAWKGSVVHKCCELWDLGILKESSVDPDALGYLDSWREWCHRTSFKPKRIEQPTYHSQYLYAGTPDADNDEWDVDRKTGACADWHSLQLALYSNFHPNARARRRIIVRLQANGKPITVEHTKNYALNLSVGLSAVNVARWKRER
jgi:hypothetical protein